MYKNGKTQFTNLESIPFTCIIMQEPVRCTLKNLFVGIYQEKWEFSRLSMLSPNFQFIIKKSQRAFNSSNFLQCI